MEFCGMCPLVLVYWKCNTCNSFQWYIVTSGTRHITPAHSSHALFADWGKTFRLCAFWRNPLRERGDLCNKEKLLGNKFSTYLSSFTHSIHTILRIYDLRLSYSTLMMYSTKNIHFYYPYIWDLCSTFWEINHITVQGGVAPCYEAWLYMGSTICPGQKWELSFYTRPNHPNYPRIWAFFVKI